MRIQKLWIQHYKVLHKLSMDIGDQVSDSSMDDTSYRLDLIVGVNGTGKSTLLHLLADLFQHLSRSNDSPPFKFSITYRLDKDPQRPITVTITNLRENLSQRFHIHVEGDPADQFDGQSDKIDQRYLPNFVVAFTSGSEEGWLLPSPQASAEEGDLIESLSDISAPNFEQQLHQWYQQEQREKNKQQLYPPATLERNKNAEQNRNAENSFLFIQYNQLPLIILCGLLIDLYNPLLEDVSQHNQYDPRNNKPKSGLLNKALEEIKITALRSFSLRFHINSENIAPDDNSLIQELINIATHTIQQGDGSSLLIFHLYDQHNHKLVQRLITLQGNALSLFRRLNQLATPESKILATLSEVNLFLERDYRSDNQRTDGTQQERAPLHMLEWFSDGEVSFLGRLCLLSLLRENDALILLDEPEVHFNDYWKRQLVSMLSRFIEDQYSHVLMTTHSSITLSDVYNTNIWVMKRNGIFTEYAAPPNLRTLGTDPSDIIVHIFGAESATGAQSIDYIQDKIKRIHDEASSFAEKIGLLEILLNNVGPGPLRFLIRREIYTLQDQHRSLNYQKENR